MKTLANLELADFSKNNVWEFVNDDDTEETAVRPVRRLPARNLDQRVVGTQVTLANGTKVWAIIGNVETSDARITEQFLTLTIERAGQWFELARYHDVDYKQHGPIQLAEFLGLGIDDIFPVSYDLRAYSEGVADALLGVVRKEPRERLNRDELLALAVPPPPA